ncbi:hypothetical protein ACEPAG_7451 [Sanghuangporus baumii]
MSSNTTQSLACHIVYMPYEIKSGTLRSLYSNAYPFRVPEDGYVSDLENAIRDHPDLNRHLGRDEPILLKVFLTRYNSALEWIRDNAQNEEIRMTGGILLTDYFGTGSAPPSSRVIDVIKEGRYALPNNIRASNVSKDRLSQLDDMQRFPSPSEGVTSEENIREWANEQHWLRHRLRHLDQIDEPSADHFEWAHKFIQVCNNGLRKEDLMEGELSQIVDALIGEDATWQEYLQDSRTTPDAVWGQIIRAILELKDVDGVGGNPTLQATLDYAKILFQARNQIRPSTGFMLDSAYFFFKFRTAVARFARTGLSSSSA